MNIGREEESLNIININLLIKFNKTQKTFPSAPRVLNFLLTLEAASASEERANSTERVPKVPGSSQAASSAQR